MLVKLGVYIDKLNPEIRGILSIVENSYQRVGGVESVLTSTNEGNHNPSSGHYGNDAADFRTRNLMEHQKEEVRDDLQKRLGPTFRVLLRATHLHIRFKR